MLIVYGVFWIQVFSKVAIILRPLITITISALVRNLLWSSTKEQTPSVAIVNDTVVFYVSDINPTNHGCCQCQPRYRRPILPLQDAQTHSKGSVFSLFSEFYVTANFLTSQLLVCVRLKERGMESRRSLLTCPKFRKP